MTGITFFTACAALTVAETWDAVKRAKRGAHQKALARTYAAAAAQQVRKYKGHVDLEETDLRRS